MLLWDQLLIRKESPDLAKSLEKDFPKDNQIRLATKKEIRQSMSILATIAMKMLRT